MGPPSTILAVSSLLLLAGVAQAQHEGFNVAPQAIHSGVVAFRRDQYSARYYRQAYDPSSQQYAQAGPQNSYQVSGSVAPPQNLEYAGSAAQGYNQMGPAGYAQQPQQFQPPAAPLSPFLPQQQEQLQQGSYQSQGQYALAPQQQYPGAGIYQQAGPQQQQQYIVMQQPHQFYQQGPPMSPAAPNPFYGQQQQAAYVQQQPQQFQALPVAQPPQFQQQPQQYPQAAPLQQQTYAQQPLPQAQYAAQPPQQHLPRPVAVIAPPPLVQQLPVAVARPAPPPPVQLVQREQVATAAPPPDRFAPYVEDVRNPAAAVAATARPHHAQPVPFETVTVIAVDSHSEQVADTHTRAEAVAHQPRKQLRHKKKKVKVLPTSVETVTVAAPVAPVTSRHRVVTTTFPPSIAPPSVTRKQQLQVRPSTLPPTPPPQIVTKPPAHVHKPSNRPSKLIELTTAAAVASGGGKSPNDVFLQCCRETGIDAKCHSRCNFDTLTKKVLTGMFLGTDPCPQKNGRNMLSCAAQNGDHTPCCMERGVHTTAAKNKCLGFCVMTPGSSFQADISMLPCWAVLNDIKGCFKDAILDQ